MRRSRASETPQGMVDRPIQAPGGRRSDRAGRSCARLRGQGHPGASLDALLLLPHRLEGLALRGLMPLGGAASSSVVSRQSSVVKSRAVGATTDH